MYADPTHMHFLDQTDYNEWSVSLEHLSDTKDFVTADLEGMLALIYNDECVGIQLPTAVELTVIECEPGCPRQFRDRPQQARQAGDRAERAGARVHRRRGNESRSTRGPASTCRALRPGLPPGRASS